MPDNPSVYIALIFAVAVVAALMVWKGTGGKVTWGKKTFQVNDGPKAPPEVVVARELKVTDGEVGKITGVKQTSSGAPGPVKVDVASGMSVSHGKTGDITGIEITRPDSTPKKK